MRRLARAEERLEGVGTIIVKWMLASDTIGTIRLAIAEGRRFPALASRVNGIALERADEAVGRVLRELAQSDELGKLQAFLPGHLATTTRFLLDLVVSALLIRALR
jgi:AefR-like transcriptional repressor, C-terminal domain